MRAYVRARARALARGRACVPLRRPGGRAANRGTLTPGELTVQARAREGGRTPTATQVAAREGQRRCPRVGPPPWMRSARAPAYY